MRATQLTVMVLVLAFATACDTRPTPEIEAAREARAATASSLAFSLASLAAVANSRVRS